uniref:cDNA FLJ60524 n=1 Tax=Homo sapiens TaxID=9606 RepID=B4DH84_HUMAN|nr:unnamed protein product [Homo sapiens]
MATHRSTLAGYSPCSSPQRAAPTRNQKAEKARNRQASPIPTRLPRNPSLASTGRQGTPMSRKKQGSDCLVYPGHPPGLWPVISCHLGLSALSSEIWTSNCLCLAALPCDTGLESLTVVCWSGI